MVNGSTGFSDHFFLPSCQCLHNPLYDPERYPGPDPTWLWKKQTVLCPVMASANDRKTEITTVKSALASCAIACVPSNRKETLSTRLNVRPVTINAMPEIPATPKPGNDKYFKYYQDYTCNKKQYFPMFGKSFEVQGCKVQDAPQLRQQSAGNRCRATAVQNKCPQS